MGDISLMLQGYQLTTAEIVYHLPDYPELLQSYIWQDYDLAPKYPVLKKFLHFWEHSLEGKMHSVTISSKPLLSPAECAYFASEWKIH